MANPEQLKLIRQGVETWNQWRKDNPTIEVDLSEANSEVLTSVMLTWKKPNSSKPI